MDALFRSLEWSRNVGATLVLVDLIDESPIKSTKNSFFKIRMKEVFFCYLPLWLSSPQVNNLRRHLLPRTVQVGRGWICRLRG